MPALYPRYTVIITSGPPAGRQQKTLRLLNRRIEEARAIIHSENTPRELADEVMWRMEGQYSRYKNTAGQGVFLKKI